MSIPQIMKNKSYPLGSIVMVEQVEKDFGLLSEIFAEIGGKDKDFLEIVKVHLCNKLSFNVSIRQILDTYPHEFFQRLGVREVPAQRTFYRPLERIGKHFPLIHYNLMHFLKKHKFVSEEQIVDFTSTYFEGEKVQIAEKGFSRDYRPDRKQINLGISTGINDIPTALTIHKGNTNDKRMFRAMVKVVSVVLPKNSVLIYDAGANTKANRKLVRTQGYHYLTRMEKKVAKYRDGIKALLAHCQEGKVEHIVINARNYFAIKLKREEDFEYIYFCPELYEEQVKKKQNKFRKAIEKGDKLLRKRKFERLPSHEGWVTLIPSLQKTLVPIENPYLTGMEGYLILQSSLDAEPGEILRLFKARDKAEKFIRMLKEGIELRPLRVWTEHMVIGMVFIAYLANLIINLTLHFAEKTQGVMVKNVKNLKKFLINLTETVIYPPNGFRFRVISNFTEPLKALFGDFIKRFEDKTLPLRW